MSLYKYFVGVDLGFKQHQVCVLDAEGGLVDEFAIAHSGEDVQRFVARLLSLAEAETLAVGIETPHGTVVSALAEKRMAVFAINPKQLDRFRDRHSAAGCKDDRRDAFVLAQSLRTDERCFRRVHLGDAERVQLRELSRLHEELVVERGVLASRLQQQLYRYFHQFLELGSVHDEPWLWALLERAPTPKAAARLALAKIGSILKTHHIRRITAEHVRETLLAQSLVPAPGVAEAAMRHVQSLLPRLRLVQSQLDDCDREMERALKQFADDEKLEHRDARILLSLPGVGTVVGATMLAEAGQALAERDYQGLRTLSGTAPVTRASGKRSGRFAPVTMRLACNRRLRTAIYHWASGAIRYDPRSRALYKSIRARGKTHGRAIRGLADRLLAMLFAMLKSGAPYDPARRQLPEGAPA